MYIFVFFTFILLATRQLLRKGNLFIKIKSYLKKFGCAQALFNTIDSELLAN